MRGRHGKGGWASAGFDPERTFAYGPLWFPVFRLDSEEDQRALQRRRRMQRTIESCTVLLPVMWKQVAADAVGIEKLWLLFLFFHVCFHNENYIW